MAFARVVWMKAGSWLWSTAADGRRPAAACRPAHPERASPYPRRRPGDLNRCGRLERGPSHLPGRLGPPRAAPTAKGAFNQQSEAVTRCRVAAMHAIRTCRRPDGVGNESGQRGILPTATRHGRRGHRRSVRWDSEVALGEQPEIDRGRRECLAASGIGSAITGRRGHVSRRGRADPPAGLHGSPAGGSAGEWRP